MNNNNNNKEELRNLRNEVILSLKSLDVLSRLTFREDESWKNSVLCVGISIGSKEMEQRKIYTCPTFYLNKYGASEKSPREIAEEIMEQYNEISQDLVRTNIDEESQKLKEPGFILDNVFMCVQRASENEDLLLKRATPFEGIEAYLRVSLFINGEEYSMKLTRRLLEILELPEKEVWVAAERNTFDMVRVYPSEDLSFGVSDEEPIRVSLEGLNILTTKGNAHGASVMLCSGVLRTLMNRLGTEKLILIPSSVHEVIVLGDQCDISVSILRNMVSKVNEEEVEPMDQLSDYPYWVSMEADGNIVVSRID